MCVVFEAAICRLSWYV